MKTCASFLVILLLSATSALGFDGEVSFGVLSDSTLQASPDGGDRARYVSAVEVGHKMKSLRPYVRIETLMDSYNGDGTFHPSRIRYDIGLELGKEKGPFIHALHTCWHSVDRPGPVEQFNYLGIGFRF